METNIIINADCLDVMRNMPDNCVDLVLTDPPYGINADEAAKKAAEQRIKAGGKSKAGRGWKFYETKGWDKDRPQKESFDAIQRVSKNQVIWGGNYFADLLPPSMGWLIWNKCQRKFSLADAELAWTSYHKAIRTFDYSRGAAIQDGKVHPTQKPIALFKWIIEKYTKEGDIVLDPYIGSGTTAVVCEMMGRKYIGVDISMEYCHIARKRVQEAKDSMSLFSPQ